MVARRILVKTAPGLPSAQLKFGAASVNFTAAPLFQSIDRQAGLGAAAGEVWQVLTPPPGFAEAADVGRLSFASGAGLRRRRRAGPGFRRARSGATVDHRPQRRPRDGAGAVMREADTQSRDFPSLAGPLLVPRFRAFAVRRRHRRDRRAGRRCKSAHRAFRYRLRPASSHIAETAAAQISRAISSTTATPNDASDRPADCSRTSGTAPARSAFWPARAKPDGPPLGGAPFAEVVPVRVANRVVLFSNSAIARAFDYVHGLNASGAQPRRHHHDEHGRPRLAGVGGRRERALRTGRLHRDRGGQQFRQSADPQHRLSRALRPGRRRLRRHGGRQALRRSRPPPDGRELRPGQQDGDRGRGCHAERAVGPARLRGIVDLDGAGTSAATPQVAGRSRDLAAEEPRRGRRLSESLDARGGDPRRAVRQRRAERAGRSKRLGRGELRASAALDRPPAAAAALAPDRGGLRVVPVPAHPDRARHGGRRMRGSRCWSSRRCSFRKARRSKASCRPTRPRRRPPICGGWPKRWPSIPRASKALARGAAERGRPASRSASQCVPARWRNAIERLHLDHARDPNVPPPAYRPLRVYAYDPSLGAQLATLGINEATLDVRWETDLKPGPIGEYIEVIDVDPASQCCYAPVDLNHPHILTQSGLAPSEASPQFHQQMAYAVAMKTIEYFERALGRVALWAPREMRTAGRREADRSRCGDCESIRTRCAPRTPITARTARRCCSATSPRRHPRPERRCPAAWSSPPSRTTSSRTRRRMRCSTACTGASASPPIRTSSPSTRRLPTSSRCSSTSPCRKR